MARLKSLASPLVALPRAIGAVDRADAQRQRDLIRRQTNAARKLYNTRRWRDLRLEILARDGWRCQQTGEMLTGTAPAPNSPVVDHIAPHRGNLALFWDPENLQSVTKAWHDSEKQKIEKAAVSAQPAARWD